MIGKSSITLLLGCSITHQQAFEAARTISKAARAANTFPFLTDSNCVLPVGLSRLRPVEPCDLRAVWKGLLEMWGKNFCYKLKISEECKTPPKHILKIVQTIVLQTLLSWSSATSIQRLSTQVHWCALNRAPDCILDISRLQSRDWKEDHNRAPSWRPGELHFSLPVFLTSSLNYLRWRLWCIWKSHELFGKNTWYIWSLKTSEGRGTPNYRDIRWT